MTATLFDTVNVAWLNNGPVAAPRTSARIRTSYKAIANVRQTNGQGEHHPNSVPYHPASGLVAEHDQAAP